MTHRCMCVIYSYINYFVHDLTVRNTWSRKTPYFMSGIENLNLDTLLPRAPRENAGRRGWVSESGGAAGR